MKCNIDQIRYESKNDINEENFEEQTSIEVCNTWDDRQELILLEPMADDIINISGLSVKGSKKSIKLMKYSHR